MKKYNIILPIEIGENTSIDAVVEQIFGKITESEYLPRNTTIMFANGNKFTIDLPIIEEVK